MSVGSAAAGGVRLLLVSQAGGTYIPLVYSKPTTEDSSQTVQKWVPIIVDHLVLW